MSLTVRRDGSAVVIERVNRGGWASQPTEEVDRLTIEGARILAANIAKCAEPVA